MYVWRGRGRRDRRGYLLAGWLKWGAPKDWEDSSEEDERLRCNLEETHMKYFHRQIRPLMHRFLDSKYGLEEIG